MPTINAKIDDEVLLKFRDVIYRRTGLKKGDFRDTLEKAMLEYIEKYSESDSAKESAKRVKSKR